MTSGVKVVGAPGQKEIPSTPRDEGAGREEADPRPLEETADGRGHRGSRRSRRRGGSRAISVLAVLGLIGTAVFAFLWAGKGSSISSDPAMTTAARAFLTDLTNFNAKSIDADFNSITGMATGAFSGQADKFFNSSIRSELETALAESRGQIRNLYTQSDNGNQAAVYGVVDQVYVNNKITTPQTDVLRVVVNLQKVGSAWKISDVTVLEGATPASAGTASGSSGSTVPGQ
jgi:hypothetical protein